MLAKAAIAACFQRMNQATEFLSECVVWKGDG